MNGNPLKAAGAAMRGKGGVAAALAGKLTFRPIVYGYANARVHGMVSQFLTSQQLIEMTKATSAQTLNEMLERSIYKEDLVALSLRFKGEDLIELALGRHFARFAKKLLKLTPEAGQLTIKALLSRWDAHNIKAIVLAKKQGSAYEHIAPYLVVAGTLKETELKSLHETASVDEFLNRLSTTEFGSAMLKSFSGHTALKIIRGRRIQPQDFAALSPLMDAVDVYPYELALKASSEHDKDSMEIKKLLSRMADEKNLSTVMRLVNSGEKIEFLHRYLVPGGIFDYMDWTEVAKNPDSPEVLARIGRKLNITKILDEYRQKKSLSELEVALTQNTAKQGLRSFHNAGLGLGVIVGALLIKEQEMSNVRKIVRGRALGLDEAAIHDILVMVKTNGR